MACAYRKPAAFARDDIDLTKRTIIVRRLKGSTDSVHRLPDGRLPLAADAASSFEAHQTERHGLELPAAWLSGTPTRVIEGAMVAGPGTPVIGGRNDG